MLFFCKSAWSASRWGWFSIFFTSSWTRRCSACFTTACGNPDTLKSMSCSSFRSTNTGLSVLVWSSSTCLGVNTQRSVDSCPHTGLPVLVGSLTLSCVSWLRVSRSNLVRSRVSSLYFVTSLTTLAHILVSPYLIIGFLVLVGFVGSLYCFLQHQNPNHTSNHLCRKFLVVVEVTQIPLVCNFFRFHHNYFRDTIRWECIVQDDCVRSCLMELQSFPFSKLYVDSIHRILVPFFHFCLYDARRGLVKSSSCGSLWSLFMGFTAVKDTVCLTLLEFCPPAINPEFVMECKVTAHPIW